MEKYGIMQSDYHARIEDMKHTTFDGTCPCQDTTVLALSRTTVSRIIAGATVLCFFIFVAGYFWGKKHATESFMSAVNEEALVDKMQVALNTISPATNPLDAMSDNNEDHVAALEKELDSPEAQAAAPITQAGKWYTAQLIGFGSERTADQFVKKLARKGVSEVVVAPQTSRSSSGKKRTWYQVVTKPFADHQQVVALVDRIKQIEKLHDVRIVAQNA